MTLEEAKKIIKSECYIADLLDLDRTQMVNTALDMAIMAIIALEKTRWIPCSERLPDEKVEVLVTTKRGNITTAERYSANKCFIYDGAVDADINDIIAWRELPQPYKAEGSDEE